MLTYLVENPVLMVWIVLYWCYLGGKRLSGFSGYKNKFSNYASSFFSFCFCFCWPTSVLLKPACASSASSGFFLTSSILANPSSICACFISFSNTSLSLPARIYWIALEPLSFAFYWLRWFLFSYCVFKSFCWCSASFALSKACFSAYAWRVSLMTTEVLLLPDNAVWNLVAV